MSAAADLPAPEHGARPRRSIRRRPTRRSPAERRARALLDQLGRQGVPVPGESADAAPASEPPIEIVPPDGPGSLPWRGPWLLAYANSGNVRAACERAGIDRQTVWELEQADPDFRAQKALAFKDWVDALRAAATQRGLQSSDRLLAMLLEAHEPETYARDRRIRLIPEMPGGLGGAVAGALTPGETGAEAVDVRDDRVILVVENGQALLPPEGTNGHPKTNGGPA